MDNLDGIALHVWWFLFECLFFIEGCTHWVCENSPLFYFIFKWCSVEGSMFGGTLGGQLARQIWTFFEAYKFYFIKYVSDQIVIRFSLCYYYSKYYYYFHCNYEKLNMDFLNYSMFSMFPVTPRTRDRCRSRTRGVHRLNSLTIAVHFKNFQTAG